MTDRLRMLLVTAMFPHKGNISDGVFVKTQIDSIAAEDPNMVIDVLHMQGHRKLRYLRGAVQVLLATRGGRYDLIHGHYGLAALSASFRFRTPLVVTLHGSDVYIPWQRVVSRIACLSAQTIIVQSQDMRRQLGIPGARVIPVGIDLSLFRELDQAACRRMLGLPLDAPVVLFPSDPRRRVKRFDLFQQAISHLHSLGRTATVMTLPAGLFPHEQMPVVFNACDVLVLTSDTEGSPMVIKEAMACNLPIVSVNAGDVVEIIGEAEGCYVASRDPTDIAVKIALSLDKGDRTRGRERVLHLSQAMIARQIIEIYRQAANLSNGEGVAAWRGSDT